MKFDIYQIAWGRYSNGQKVAMHTRMVANGLTENEAITSAEGCRNTYISETFVITPSL
jgi:hypothetical protein